MPGFSMSSTAVVVLIGLVAGHLMIDFALQTDNDIRLKRQFRVSAFAKHGLVHAAVAYCLSGLWLMWQIPVAILFVHPAIDFVKERGELWLGSRVRDGILPVRWKLAALLADQALHISVLIAMVAILQSSEWIGEATFWTALFGFTWGKMMVLAAGFTFSVYVGGVVIAPSPTTKRSTPSTPAGRKPSSRCSRN